MSSITADFPTSTPRSRVARSSDGVVAAYIRELSATSRRRRAGVHNALTSAKRHDRSDRQTRADRQVQSS